MSKTNNMVAVALTGLALSGCAVYDGAIYTSYDQVDISIRSAPETATPFSINFGRQRAEVSFVPHKDGTDIGEAVSVFGRASTSSIIPNQAIAGAASAAANAVQTANTNLENLTTARTDANKAAMDAATAAVTANAAATDAAIARVAAAATRSEETRELAVVNQRALATSMAADRLLNRTRTAEDIARNSADQASKNLAALQTLQTGTNNLQLLRAEGRFASGNAAKLLVIPKGRQVVIRKPGGKELDLGTLTTTPVQRASLFIADAVFASESERNLAGLFDAINEKCATGVSGPMEKMYGQAVHTVDTCFSNLAKRYTTPGMPESEIFNQAYDDYTDENLVKKHCSGVDISKTDIEKDLRVFDALNKAFAKFCS